MSAEENNTIRLNRYLARCGLGSRRECDRLIASGGIEVNGERVKKLGTTVEPSHDVIRWRGKKVGRVLPLEYIAYHKSRGSLVTAKDPEGRETIYDALGRSGLEASHLKYVGRLDRNSEGLLLLTNDGALLHALTHPRFEIKKTYNVRIDKPLREEHAAQMTSEGVSSEGQLLRAGRIRRLEGREPGQHWYEMDLYQGKNRQIRRMLEAFGYEVVRLKRTQFAVIKLGSLRRGAFRRLSEREISGLLRLGYGASAKRRTHASASPVSSTFSTSSSSRARRTSSTSHFLRN